MRMRVRKDEMTAGRTDLLSLFKARRTRGLDVLEFGTGSWESGLRGTANDTSWAETCNDSTDDAS